MRHGSTLIYPTFLKYGFRLTKGSTFLRIGEAKTKPNVFDNYPSNIPPHTPWYCGGGNAGNFESPGPGSPH